MRQRILAGIILSLTAATSVAAGISGQGTWETTLQGRLPLTPGGTDYRAYFDTALNITWVADANLAWTSGYEPEFGVMTWNKAQTWIASLNTASYLGVSDWRLPTVTDTGSPGCNFAYSGTDCGYNVDLTTGEMAHMFYSTLGNAGYYDTGANPTGCSGSCLTNDGPFSNLQPDGYWSGTEYAPYAWDFDFSVGYQTMDPKVGDYKYAWAVRPGDIAAVPLPAVGWLLAPAFSVLGVRRSNTRSRNKV